MFLLKWLGRRDDQQRPTAAYPLKLRLDGDWRLILRGGPEARRVAMLISDIGPGEINVRGDWRRVRLQTGERWTAELHLSPEEEGPTLPVVVAAVDKVPVDFVYSANLRFERLTSDERRQLDYFLRRLRMRERMGGSTRHLV